MEAKWGRFIGSEEVVCWGAVVFFFFPVFFSSLGCEDARSGKRRGWDDDGLGMGIGCCLGASFFLVSEVFFFSFCKDWA